MPSTESESSLPDDIVQSIAISNATSIGSQPAILANLALANQIFNQSLQQQLAISYQQATHLITLAAVARCVNLITTDTAAAPGSADRLQELLAMLKTVQNPAPDTAAK